MAEAAGGEDQLAQRLNVRREDMRGFFFLGVARKKRTPGLGEVAGQTPGGRTRVHKKDATPH